MTEIIDLTSPKDVIPITNYEHRTNRRPTVTDSVQSIRPPRSNLRSARTDSVRRSSQSPIVIVDDQPNTDTSSSIIDLSSEDDSCSTSSLEPLNTEIAATAVQRRAERRIPESNDDVLVSVRTNSFHQSLDDTDVIVIEKENKTASLSARRHVGSDDELDDPYTPKRKVLSCPICMDHERTIRRTGRQLVSTICGHIFCSNCLNQTITTMKCCPTCRKKLNKKTGFHPIFV